MKGREPSNQQSIRIQNPAAARNGIKCCTFGREGYGGGARMAGGLCELEWKLGRARFWRFRGSRYVLLQ